MLTLTTFTHLDDQCPSHELVPDTNRNREILTRRARAWGVKHRDAGGLAVVASDDDPPIYYCVVAR